MVPDVKDTLTSSYLCFPPLNSRDITQHRWVHFCVPLWKGQTICMKRQTQHGEYGGYGLGIITLKRRVITSMTRGGIGIVSVDHNAAAADASMCRVQVEARGRSDQSCTSLYSDCWRSAGGVVENPDVVLLLCPRIEVCRSGCLWRISEFI